jgi:hypothetical protein
VLQQQINQIRRFLSNAQTPDSVIAHTAVEIALYDHFAEACKVIIPRPVMMTKKGAPKGTLDWSCL